MMFRLRLDSVTSAGGRNQFLNTAIVREVTSRRDPLLAHTPTSSVAVASVYWEQCLRLLRWRPCFVLPSHSDNRVSHVLLPVLPFTWLLFLHWMSFRTFACQRLLKRLWFFLWGGGGSGEVGGKGW